MIYADIRRSGIGDRMPFNRPPRARLAVTSRTDHVVEYGRPIGHKVGMLLFLVVASLLFGAVVRDLLRESRLLIAPDLHDAIATSRWIFVGLAVLWLVLAIDFLRHVRWELGEDRLALDGDDKSATMFRRPIFGRLRTLRMSQSGVREITLSREQWPTGQPFYRLKIHLADGREVTVDSSREIAELTGLATDLEQALEARVTRAI
jgi:hypothetical protein